MEILKSHFTPDKLHSGYVGEYYSRKIEVSGGKAPYIFGSEGTNPPGLEWGNIQSDSIYLQGTPTIEGNYPIKLNATDADGKIFSVNF